MKNFSIKRIIAGILSTIMVMTSLNLSTIEVKAANNEWNFSYTGNVQEFTAPYSGKYKLETWGAQGGSSAIAGALGGYGYVEVALLKGEKLFIVVGGQGNSSGNGGYNGGGDSISGGSGGGATHIAIKTGLLKDLSSNKDSILIVSGGGGGSYKSVLPNQSSWLENFDSNGNSIITPIITDAYSLPGAGGGGQGIDTTSTAENHNCSCMVIAKGGTQTSGYRFGQGESGIVGGGGGYFGGQAGSDYFLSGAGGSGYAIETEFLSELNIGKNSGNGKAKITYEGELNRTITISTNGCGTYNGKDGEIVLSVKSGDSISLSDIECYDGYTFLGYLNNGNLIEKSFIMGKENLKLKASFYAPLVISKEKDGINSIRINMSQNDDIDKYYKVYQSKDGVNWYDAALALDAKDKIPSKNMQYSPGQYNYTVPFTGDYKVRLYGAQGGNASSPWGTGIGGKGAYTEGIITLEKGTKLVINIGAQGYNGSLDPSGSSHSGGGHESDIMVDSNSIQNRIIVAAGGGGGSTYV